MNNITIALAVFDITNTCVSYFLLKEKLEELWHNKNLPDVQIPELLNNETGLLGFSVEQYEFFSGINVRPDEFRYCGLVQISQKKWEQLKITGNLLIE